MGKLHPGFAFSTLIDTVNIALWYLLLQNYRNLGETRLIGGFKNIVLPSPPSDLFKDDVSFRIKLFNDQSKLGKSGVLLIPFEGQFLNCNSIIQGFLAKK